MQTMWNVWLPSQMIIASEFVKYSDLISSEMPIMIGFAHNSRLKSRIKRHCSI